LAYIAEGTGDQLMSEPLKPSNLVLPCANKQFSELSRILCGFMVHSSFVYFGFLLAISRPKQKRSHPLYFKGHYHSDDNALPIGLPSVGTLVFD
jgi:hypothetical protein